MVERDEERVVLAIGVELLAEVEDEEEVPMSLLLVLFICSNASCCSAGVRLDIARRLRGWYGSVA